MFVQRIIGVKKADSISRSSGEHNSMDRQHMIPLFVSM